MRESDSTKFAVVTVSHDRGYGDECDLDVEVPAPVFDSREEAQKYRDGLDDGFVVELCDCEPLVSLWRARLEDYGQKIAVSEVLVTEPTASTLLSEDRQSYYQQEWFRRTEVEARQAINNTLVKRRDKYRTDQENALRKSYRELYGRDMPEQS